MDTIIHHKHDQVGRINLSVPCVNRGLIRKTIKYKGLDKSLEIRLRKDTLYVGGKKIFLFRSGDQRRCEDQGYSVIRKNNIFHKSAPLVLAEFIEKNPRFFSEDWKYKTLLFAGDLFTGYGHYIYGLKWIRDKPTIISMSRASMFGCTRYIVNISRFRSFS